MFVDMFREEEYTASDQGPHFEDSVERFYQDTSDTFGFSGQALAWRGEEPAGFIWILEMKHFITGEKMGMIGSIYVKVPFRGQGLGKQLLGWGEAYCQRREYTRMTLNVFWQNAPARHLYERAGFLPISTTMEKSLSK
jgi:ribosomal protein S18 acetylase RimI-like enzyme